MGVVLRLYVDIVRVCCTYLAFVTSWVVDLYMIDIVPIFKSSSLTLLMVFRVLETARTLTNGRDADGSSVGTTDLRQLLNVKKREREKDTLTLAQQQARPPKVGGYRRGSMCPMVDQCETDNSPCSLCCFHHHNLMESPKGSKRCGKRGKGDKGGDK